MEGEDESTEASAIWSEPWKEFLNRVEGQQWVPAKEPQEGKGGKLEREWGVAKEEFTDFRSEEGRVPPTAVVKPDRRSGEETGEKQVEEGELGLVEHPEVVQGGRGEVSSEIPPELYAGEEEEEATPLRLSLIHI